MTKRFANFYELAEIFSFFSYTQRWPVRYGTGTGTAPSKGKLSQTALHFSVSYHLNTYVLDSINFLIMSVRSRELKTDYCFPGQNPKILMICKSSEFNSAHPDTFRNGFYSSNKSQSKLIYKFPNSTVSKSLSFWIN